MKQSRFYALMAVVFACGLVFLPAQQKEAAPSVTLSAAEQAKRPEGKYSKAILEDLKLGDAEKEAKLKEILAVHFQVLNAWHAQNDTQIKALWGEFDKARSAQSEAGANATLEKIDGVYASFKPQHEKFLGELSMVLTPGQIERVKDVMTVDKVKVTFHAYGEIFHGLTDEHNAFILKNLKAAREEAIDAGPMTEKSAFFKKYKIKIEAYLTAHGYDVKQSYREFVAKQKAEEAAKKTAATPANEQKN